MKRQSYQPLGDYDYEDEDEKDNAFNRLVKKGFDPDEICDEDLDREEYECITHVETWLSELERKDNAIKFRVNTKLTSFVLESVLSEDLVECKAILDKYGFIYDSAYHDRTTRIHVGWLSNKELKEFIQTMQEAGVSGEMDFIRINKNGYTSGCISYCEQCDHDRQEYLKFGIVNGQKWQRWCPVGGS